MAAHHRWESMKGLLYHHLGFVNRKMYLWKMQAKIKESKSKDSTRSQVKEQT